MALKQGNCVKRVLGATSLTLQADAGESFLIKAIYCRPTSSDTYIIIRVDRKTVGVYRVYGKGGNHLGHIGKSVFPLNLMEFLASKGINVSIPVAEGQILTIGTIAATTELVVVYEIYDGSDIRSDMINGSAAKEYNFIQYMESSSDILVTGDLLLDLSVSPAEFPDFPCGKVVPAKHIIQMLGLVGNPYSYGVSEGSNIQTNFVKLIKDRETLFDEDRNGLPFEGQCSNGFTHSYTTKFSLIGGCHDGNQDSEKADIGLPLLFEPALNFVAGEELLTYVTVQQDGSGTMDGNRIDLAAILNVKVE